MNILRKLLSHPEFNTLLVLFCTALFGWPFISITGPARPEAMFVYLFLVWGAVITLLYCIAAAHAGNPNDKDPDSGN
jgi:hypothetical protein